MKKIFLVLLIAALFVSSAANADSRAALLGDRLFLSLEDADSAKLDQRTITHLQSDSDYLYYVAAEECGEEMYQESLVRMDANGNTTVIGEQRLRGAEYTYAEDYSRLTDYYYFPGYGGMTVYGGHIYFIGSSGMPGSYFTTADNWDLLSGKYETRHASTSSLYRMDLDGGNLTELVPDLGNGACHFSIANDVIALSTCWRNGVYAYDFSDFRLYSLDGSLIREIENSSEDRHSWIYKEDCEFTCIVVDIRTDGERIYASLGDSEGDFASSRLTDMDNPAETILYEAYYTPSLLCEDGFIALSSDAEDEFYSEEMAASLNLQLVSPEGIMMLAYVPDSFAHWGNMHLTLLEDKVYITSGSRAIRVPLYGGTVEEWTADGFVPAREFDPDNYGE